MNYPYNPRLKKFARELRKNSTLGEILLWNSLKRRQCLGFDFHRQRPIDEYIVDFFCPALALAIEVDGLSHDFRAADDRKKEVILRALGIVVLRFGEREVRSNCDGVVKEIQKWIQEHTPPL